MKRGWKIFWIIIASVTAFGIVFSCIALGLGFTFSTFRAAYPNGIGIIKDREDDDWEDDWDERTRVEPSEDVMKFEDVTELDVSVGFCEVVIAQSDDELTKVDTSGLDFKKSGKDISVHEENGVLSIEMQENGSSWNALSHLKGTHNYGTLYIYLPESSTLESAELILGAVDVQIDVLKVRNLDMKIGATDCKVDSLEADTVNMEVGAGDLEIRGAIYGDVDVKCGAGSVGLELEGQETDFNYAVEGGIGAIDIGEHMEFEGIAVSKNIDNGSNKTMDLQCGAGEIEVSFRHK